MSHELVPVTILVPPPPDGYAPEAGRIPIIGEKVACWSQMYGRWEIIEWGKGDSKTLPLAFPKPRPKRLLTPAELAGCWIRFRAGEVEQKDMLVVGVAQLAVLSDNKWWSVKYLHERKCTYSTTPDGPRLPLETEDGNA